MAFKSTHKKRTWILSDRSDARCEYGLVKEEALNLGITPRCQEREDLTLLGCSAHVRPEENQTKRRHDICNLPTPTCSKVKSK